MNAPRLSELMPLNALGGAPAASRPVRPERPQIMPAERASEGGSGIPDAARRRVEEERQRQEERFKPAQTLVARQRDEHAENRSEAVDRAGLESNRERAEAATPKRNFANRVGFFDGTTIMFVDLVDTRTQRELLRIFGPTAPPKGDPKDPADASRAYRRAAGRRGGTGGGLEA